MYFVVIMTLLLNTSYGANILGVFMFPSYSHQVIFQDICRELSLRGHNVTAVTTDPLNDPKLSNLTEISISFVYEDLERRQFQKIYAKDLDNYQVVRDSFDLIEFIAEKELNSTQMRKLISEENKFDLILLELLHPAFNALSYRFNAPIVAILTLLPLNPAFDAIGNPNHPILYSLLNYESKNLTMWQRIDSVYFFIWVKYFYYYLVLPRAYDIARKYFGDVPYVGDLEKNISLLLLMSNFVIHPPRAHVPALIDISPFNYQPPNALPKDLQKTLDEATEGVIYFSFGTNVKSNLLGEKQRSVILQALSELPYKVLLKWDSENISNKSSNIIARRWFPQSDLLAHRNIKVFVTQGGLQSIEDAISREVPMVGVPFASDQPRNIRRLVELQIGEQLDINTLTKNKLRDTIIKVAENPSYKNAIKEVRKIWYDKPRSGLEDAVWWCEYVIRHKGAKYLRSPSVDMSICQYLLLDVICVLILAAAIFLYIIWKLIVVLRFFLFRKNSKTLSKQEKKEK